MPKPDELSTPAPPDDIAASAVGADPAAAAPPDQRRDIVRRWIQIAASLLFTALLLFGFAGTWRWPEAWLFIGLYGGCTAAAALLFAPRHPEVVAARSHMRRSEAPRWDQVIATAWAILSVAVPAVAGLEYRLHGPAAWPIAVVVIGSAGLVLSYALVVWAMSANPFFETMVRIQRERGHVTVSSGPYAYIRHPGYVGSVSLVLMMPLIFRSPWAFAPALIGTAAILARTALEDRFLQAQLAGYADYARRVRYRLVPGIW